jgi:hypothetical protein
MENTSHSQPLSNLNKHCSVVDEKGALWSRLGKVKSEPEDLNIGLTHSNETGRDECVNKPVELERANSVGINLAGLITHDDDPQAMLRFEFSHEVEHLCMRLRLSKHEVSKLASREGPLLKEHHPSQVFFEGELAFLVCLEDEAMTLIHVFPIQLEVSGRLFTRKMVPAVGEQDSTYIYKHCRNWKRFFHFSFPLVGMSYIYFEKSE